GGRGVGRFGGSLGVPEDRPDRGPQGQRRAGGPPDEEDSRDHRSWPSGDFETVTARESPPEGEGPGGAGVGFADGSTTSTISRWGCFSVRPIASQAMATW